MQQEFDPITRQLIQTMINYVNRSSGIVDGVKLPISVQYTSYYVYCSPNERRACHANLKILQENDLIHCTWHPRVLEEFETLRQINIPSGKRLLSELGVRAHADTLSDANKRLLSMRCGVTWIDNKIREIAERWRVGAKYLLLGPEHIEEVVIGLTVAMYIETESINGRCMRALSIDWFADPNIIADNIRVIAMMCESQLKGKARDLDPVDQLASLGIAVLSPIWRFRGSFKITFKNGSIFEGDIAPSIGLVADTIEDMVLKDGYTPDYVLTIEDLVTYQRYVCNVQDNGIVLYVGDYPSNEFMRVYALLMSQLSHTIEIFHWANIDLAGFRSVLTLQSVVKGREVKPFQMGAEYIQPAEADNVPLNIQKLSKLGYTCEGVMKEVIAELVALPEELRIESKQEGLPIRAPLCALPPASLLA